MPDNASHHTPISAHWTHRIGTRRTWLWRGWQIHYSYAPPVSEASPAVQAAAAADQIPILLLHGFGASIGHWRKNIPALRQTLSLIHI